MRLNNKGTIYERKRGISNMENARLTSLLTVVSSTITLSVILFITIGSGIAIEYGLISLLALIGWLKFSYKSTPSQTNTIPKYILGIVLIVALNTVRYTADFSQFIYLNYNQWFTESFTLNHTQWFVWMVCLPVSLLLFGGYYLSKRQTVGYFFAWWGFIYFTIESLLQLQVELGNYSSYNHVYYLGLILAMLLFNISVSGILKLIKPKEEEQKIEDYQPLTKKQKNLWSLLLVTFVVVYAVTLYTQAGPLPVGVIVGSMMGGMIGWRKTTSNIPADPYKLVPLYLLLQALFYIHVGEEVLTHFNRGIASISGHPWSDVEFDYVITFLGPIFWVFGAYSLWKRQVFGNFILWFMIVGMILGEPTHLLVFPIVRMVKEGIDYEYFSGMYTALFPMIPAILGLIIILKDHKKHKKAINNV